MKTMIVVLVIAGVVGILALNQKINETLKAIIDECA